jgi:hypothetical protein
MGSIEGAPSSFNPKLQGKKTIKVLFCGNQNLCTKERNIYTKGETTLALKKTTNSTKHLNKNKNYKKRRRRNYLPQRQGREEIQS